MLSPPQVWVVYHELLVELLELLLDEEEVTGTGLTPKYVPYDENHEDWEVEQSPLHGPQ